jgi:hypothetical protein
MNLEILTSHCKPAADAGPGMLDVCLGYVAGSADQVMARQSQLPANKRTVCLPANTTIGDVQRAITANLEAYENEPNAAAAVIIERSMMAAFPC